MNIFIKTGITLIFLLNIISSFAQVSENQIYKLTQVFRNISNYYVDSINENELINAAIIKTLRDLDPHSCFYSKDEVDELNRDLEGRFNGVGINYNIIRDTVRILSTIKNGPSEKAGLLAGDRIIFVEGKNIAGTGVTDEYLRALLTGNKGTKVKLSVARLGKKKLTNFVIERDLIKVSSIEAAYMVNPDVAYLKLERFSGTTVDDFNREAAELIKKGAKHLIIDLRDNGGGYLQAAVRIVDNFLDPESLIVYTEGNKSTKSEYFASKSEKLPFSRLVIIIDEGSASASEIVCGAVQDWDRGIIVGRRSFGKGLVQRPFYLADGSMMRLTVARYYTPSGRCIQKPYNGNYNEYYNDIENRLKNGEMTDADSIKNADSLKFNTLINKRVIYAGGGITPDIFVPLDTAMYPEIYQKIASSGILTTFIHDYVDYKREYFNTVFSDFEVFNEKFNIDISLIRNLVYKTWNDKFVGTTKEETIAILNSDNNVKTHIKALIANDLWQSCAYYKILNQNSKIFSKAVEVISDNDKYQKALTGKLQN